jgi:hypothetical protein
MPATSELMFILLYVLYVFQQQRAKRRHSQTLSCGKKMHNTECTGQPCLAERSRYECSTAAAAAATEPECMS